MRCKKGLLSALAVGLLAMFVGSSDAQPRLFGTVGAGGAPSTLVELDPATGGLLQTIGSVGYGVNGLTFDATSGKLYGATSYNDLSFMGLIEINMTSGVGTPVGGWGLGTSPVVCLATNASGAMYGWWEPSQDDLVSINKLTGSATLVGDALLSTSTLGLSFDSAGTLWLYNGDGDYYTINTTTGASTYVGDLNTIAHHGQLNPVTNVYFGIGDPYGGPSLGPSRNLVMLDLHNGLNLGSMGTVNNLHTLAWVHGPDPIPEPAFVQLPLLLGLGGIGAWWRRRRAG